MEHLVVNKREKQCLVFTKKNNKLDLSIECQSTLLDNLVVPKLTYGCEVWSIGDLTAVEKFRADFLKRILKVKQCSPSAMLYCYLARVPLSKGIKKSVLGFWYEILTGENKLSLILYIVFVDQYYILMRKWPHF